MLVISSEPLREREWFEELATHWRVFYIVFAVSITWVAVFETMLFPLLSVWAAAAFAGGAELLKRSAVLDD